MSQIRKASLRERITIYRRVVVGQDTYGADIYGESPGVVVPAALDVRDATEEEISRDTRVQRYRVTVAPDAVLGGIDRIEWRGRSLEVIGEPQPETLRGSVHHIEFDVREVRG